MMDVKEVKTQVVKAKEKLFGGEVTMAKTDLAIVAIICVLVGMVLGLCKGLKICAGEKEKECKCKKEDCVTLE